MSEEFKLPIWAAKCCGNQKNCVYPDSFMVTDAETMKKVVRNDHTFICFKNNYRSEENYKYAFAVTEDIDNTHSDNPDDWFTKDDIIAAFPDVQMIIYTSRNHMKKKDGKAPRETVIVQHIVSAGTIDERMLKALAEKDHTQSALIEAVKAEVVIDGSQ